MAGFPVRSRVNVFLYGPREVNLQFIRALPVAVIDGNGESTYSVAMRPDDPRGDYGIWMNPHCGEPTLPCVEFEKRNPGLPSGHRRRRPGALRAFPARVPVLLSAFAGDTGGGRLHLYAHHFRIYRGRGRTDHHLRGDPHGRGGRPRVRAHRGGRPPARTDSRTRRPAAIDRPADASSHRLEERGGRGGHRLRQPAVSRVVAGRSRAGRSDRPQRLLRRRALSTGPRGPSGAGRRRLEGRRQRTIGAVDGPGLSSLPRRGGRYGGLLRRLHPRGRR
jgi:hypothetical protein